MPAGFDFPNDAVVWKPVRLSDYVRQARGALWLHVVGRLADGVSIARAQTDMDVVAAAQAEAYPDVGAGRGIFVQDGLSVAIVNQAMVRRYWPDEEPIGKRFKMGGPDSESPWWVDRGRRGRRCASHGARS